MDKEALFYDYFEEWVKIYKVGAVSERTLSKYWLTHRHLKRIAPDLKLNKISRIDYQNILNEYAKNHEKTTALDFHHHLRSSLLDAFDDLLIMRDPTRKVVVKGKKPSNKKKKYLNEFELKLLLRSLDLSDTSSSDWLILLMAKTGMRFGEALGLTEADFDFENQTISVNKTWDYKEAAGGFKPTKNESSVRKIQLDWKLNMQLSQLLDQIEVKDGQPIFVRNKRVFNSTINDRLERRCKSLQIPVISIHGLRHTHASLLLFAGVSIASVAKRLGHADTSTTQQVYLHIIQELETQDINKIMRHLSEL